ncbi:MAG: bifunctional diaminohydroxyphosphoribosylaminopyrimidine deaminase/5-amino-6-(5-phosphoribosylamino)uracil reductase RibD [Cephaloticoccus sp.]|nr:bifunctional diaminohydroxyphosphoribosylaminopyrimidine deaminase/5-amino-6-(5-phosphoribosylamino)uracil reductase RibD [Cephaloticoccus sp.]MCF7759940.1 bifunctional diaminohydroxyphosphoribosylaminopyrimidine deaminase/5-amino-6-(5-phosphoribosylamino)uracil reductase RibD [Cephaloticoccus sp.]
MSTTEQVVFMRRALELAQSAWGLTHPNPMVGAVLVEDGKIVGEGATAPDGGPHAERLALLARGKKPRAGATLYVTMEPCSTVGRTGACTDAIIAAGVKKVVVGTIDPNPAHAGKGYEVLRAAGIEVTTGVIEAECQDLNLIFNHWITTGTPLLAAKTATTLDGRIACRTGDSRWITGLVARADVMRWRRLFPAIAVGAGTLMQDNPRLTSRIEGVEEWCPVRFVFDGLLRSVTDKTLPAVYSDEFRARTIVVTTPHGGMGYVRKLRDLGVEVWVMPSTTQRVAFVDFRRKCADAGISGVYFEGGAQLLSQLLRDAQIDYLFSYRAPMILGDDRAKPMMNGLRTEKLINAVRLTDVRHTVLGDDMLARGKVVYPEKMFVDETVFSLR